MDRGRDPEGKRTFGETYNLVMVIMTGLISAVAETFGMHHLSSGWHVDRQKPWHNPILHKSRGVAVFGCRSEDSMGA